MKWRRGFKILVCNNVPSVTRLLDGVKRCFCMQCMACDAHLSFHIITGERSRSVSVDVVEPTTTEICRRHCSVLTCCKIFVHLVPPQHPNHNDNKSRLLLYRQNHHNRLLSMNMMNLLLTGTTHHILFVVFLIAMVSATSTQAFLHVGSVTTHLRRAPPSSSLFAIQEASFGMGCFWQPAEDLLQVDGVVDTVAGYTGESASKSPPSYDAVCYSRNNWVEGVRVRYDDSILTYAQLLDAFFEYQTPKFGSRQYASVIFTHNQEQEDEAHKWMEQSRFRKDGLPSSITTIEPLQVFYKAEEYHQRYWAKLRPRLAFAFACLLVSSGAADQWIPSDLISTVQTAANSVVLAGAVLLMVERKFQTKTQPI